jgi:hypothetical protein
MVEHVEEFGPAQRPVFVGEPDSAVQLGVAGQASLQPGHADQQEPHLVVVVDVAQLFQAGGR